MLRLRSLGQTIIETKEALVTPSAETIFATSLYLIMEAGRPIGREELTRMVWPGVTDTQAQHGLRQVLYKLKSFGATIKADRSSLMLAPRFCSTDFAELLEPQPNSVLEALAGKVGGSFLPGYCPELSEQFATWVERQRDIVHSALARALVAGMQAKKRVSDWSGAEQLASMCLTIDPLNEEATLTVAEAAALGGSKAKALSILNNYLREIGDDAGEIKLPAALLRRRISEAYQDNIFVVRDAPFVGREEEMAELTRALARAQGGHGSAYVITGEPGIGKTRLVQEFTKVAALQRVHIVRVGCQSHDVRRPLSVFVDMVPKLLALPGALGCSPESMGYLKRLTALDKEDATLDREGKYTEGIFEHVRAAVLDLTAALTCECCLVVQIEDAHWADVYSQSLLNNISADACTHRLLLLKSHTQASPLTSGVGPTHATSLHINPLSAEASASLVDNALSARASVSTTFRDWCIRSGCGNPFFVVELSMHGADDGSFTAPPSLKNLIESRLLSLNSLSRRVLQASCILGRHSRLSTIEEVLGERRIDLLHSLDELTAGGFIDYDPLSIASRHALITEAALNKASTASKALLHRHAAKALEVAATENATVLWDCAEHWRQAGDHEKAVNLMADCARHSLELGLPLEAAMMLEAGADLALNKMQIALLHDCCRAYSIAGEWDEAHRISERIVDALKRAAASSDLVAEAELENFVIAGRVSGLSQGVLSRLLTLISSTDLSLSLRLRAASLALMAADNMQDRTLANCVYAAISCIEPSLEGEQAQLQHCLLIYYCSFGDAQKAISSMKYLTDFARKTHDFNLRALYLEHSGHACRVIGDFETARSLYIEAHEIASAKNLYHRAEAASASLVGLDLSSSNLDSARRWCDKGNEEFRRSGRGTPTGEILSYESELFIREGQYDRARALILFLQEYSARLNSVRARARQLALEADLKMSSGGSLTRGECDALVELAPKVAHAFRNEYFVVQLVRALVATGRPQQAFDSLDKYLLHDRLSYEPLSAGLIALQDAANRYRVNALTAEFKIDRVRTNKKPRRVSDEA